MSVSLKFSGGKDIERALAKLPAGTAKGVMRRTLKQVLEPVRAMADSLTGEFNVAITSKLAPRQRAQARSDFSRSVVTMYVGATQEDGSNAPHAHLIEFGTGPRFHPNGKYVGYVTPEPFMQPAWDAHSATMLDEMGRLSWIEIEKALARAARKAARAG